MNRRKSSKQKTPTSDLKMAVVTDVLYKYGGSEKHLEYILKTFPNSELFVPYYGKEFVEKHFPDVEIHQSFLRLFPFKKKLKYFYLLLHPLAFKSFRFKNFDGVLSHSIIFAKFAKAPKGKKHINSCMSPPKFLWQKDDRSLKKDQQLKGINRLLFNFYTFFMDTFLEDLWKKWDRKAAQKVDNIIVISKTVKRRVKKYYGINSDVIYPPVEVEKLQEGKPINRRENWFLYLGRIETYKGVELAIRACVDANVPLKIVGKGDDEQRMHDLVKELGAKGLVSFLGYVSDQEKENLLKRARALIFPVRGEDFGIVPVEANAVGTPVIAYRSGGVVETVSEDNPKTGVFFKKYDYKALSKILKNFDEEDFDSKNCMSHAQEFDASIFMYKLKTYVEDAIQDS
jgi:glycosyltransferase involved in cell wall biosynthesis